MTKYIHYCWFGTKPLPKLAKKCIKSWKKYLPDYEIKCWNESNVNLDECPFIKEAYENKKWAFVADYARTKAMYKYGGLYFDTDMEVVKPIDELLNSNTSFLGVEDSHMIACGVWYERDSKSYLATKMLEYYRSQTFFNVDDMYLISIPRIISSILTDYDTSKMETQKLNHNVVIYSRDYFYPLSYNHQDNLFTKNTCMIHYYDASWIPKWEQRENRIFRTFGQQNGEKIIKGCKLVKKIIRKSGKLVLYPAILMKRRNDKITPKYKKDIIETISEINKHKNEKYIAFSNHSWFGVTNATIELFGFSINCSEIYRKKDIVSIGNAIIKNNIKEVIFSGFCIGWKDLAIYLKQKNPKIVLKTYFHGSHSQATEPYGWARSMEIYKLHKCRIIDQMATCKASLVNFYKNQGCNIVFLKNRVVLNKKYINPTTDEIRIGVYAAHTEIWHKNVFTQLAAISLLNKNVVVDMVPLTNDAKKFCEKLGIKVEGVNHSLPREELLDRMSKNTLNLYVTFFECAPMLPLESFAVGVPCLTGNNHHYFVNTPLEQYLVVSNESSAISIKEKIEVCLKHRDEVLDLYKDWNTKNKYESTKGVKKYIGGMNNEK